LDRLQNLADKASSVRGDVSKLDEEFAKAFEVENPVEELPTAIKRYRYYHGGLLLKGRCSIELERLAFASSVF
jgi:hypothetical protein